MTRATKTKTKIHHKLGRGDGRKNRRAAKSSYDESLSAKAAVRGAKPRKDIAPAMVLIYDDGHNYDPQKALATRSDEKGYYIHDSMVVFISPDDAYEMFVEHNYDKQRRLDEAHSRRLASTISVAVSIDFAVGPDGKPKMLNGQHTMWAIYLRGHDTQSNVKIWMCRDEQAMADLFAIFDDNKKRSLKNAIHAAQGANALTYEGAEGRLAKWSQCVGIAENEFTRKNASREGRSVQLDRAKRDDVQQFSTWMDKHVNGPMEMKLVPQGIGAAFFAMWKSDPKNAERFAQEYFTGANLPKGSATLYIRNKIGNRPRGEHAGSVCREHGEILYTAWRKFCLGEDLLQLRRTIALPLSTEWKIFRSSVHLQMA